MKKKDWKRGMAFVCSAVLLAGNLSSIGPLNRVMAEETNLFTDGDMGDDETGDSDTAADFWSAQKWYFEGETWDCTSQVKYSVWAKQAGSCGLEIDFDKASGTVCMYQTIDDLEAGTYTVTGYIMDGSGSDGSIVLYHAAKDGAWNVSEQKTALSNEYKQFTDEFTIAEDVKDYKVGFQITGEQGAWIYVDTLSLIKKEQADSVTTPSPEPDNNESDNNILYSKTFEAGTEPADMSDWTENWSADSSATSKADTGAGNDETAVWNYYSATAQNMTAARKITASENGNYVISFKTAGENVSGAISLSDGTKSVSAALTAGGWNIYTLAESSALSVTAGTELTMTISLDFTAGGYLKIDDILVRKVSEDELLAAKQEKAAELQDLIKQYSALKEKDYTTESWKVLQDLLDESQKYLDGLDGNYATIEITDIDQKINALKKAKEELKSAQTVEAEIYVEKVEGLTDDFIGGVDVSSYVSLKNSGVKYYDFDGSELDDQGFFDLLAASGINYVRVRVWNDPYDADGNGYGGGNNDLDTAIKIGQWATKAGMRVLIDFHYSDFWADPGKQQAPKAWQGLSLDEKLKKVTSFTEDSIQSLLDKGVDVGMVQVGNETNNGIAGESGWQNGGMLKVFAAGCTAVHAVADKNEHPIKAVLHFADPEKETYVDWAKQLADANVDYDVFASSYYPYWHGTLDNLQSQLDTIAKTYNKEVMVAETSWATTLEDGDGHDNTVREGNNDTQAAGMKYYDFSIYGQAKELREVINTIANTTNGIGVFYWEPAWIPVNVYDPDAENAGEVLAANKAAWEKYGSGWAASYAGEYDAKDAGKWYGGSAVDNQGLFDFSGHPLDTLNIFKYVKTGTTAERKISTIKSTTAEANLGEKIILPMTVAVTYSDATAESLTVTWNTEQIAAAEAKGVGEYSIEGTVTLDGTAYTAICKLTISPENILPDAGFESGASDIWKITGNGVSVKADSSNTKKGSYCLHFWAAEDMEYEVFQTVTLAAGEYSFGGYLEGLTDGTEDSYEIFAKYNGQEQTASAGMNGWKAWNNPEIKNIVIEDNATEVVLGIRVKASANAWGAWDEMYLYKTGEAEPKPVVTPKPGNSPEPTVTPDPSDSPAPTAASASTVSGSASGNVAQTPAVDWNTVNDNVQNKVNEVIKNPNVNSINMNVVCSGETQIPARVLESIKGSNVTLALHSGNGVAVSISGQDLKGSTLDILQKIDLTIDSSTRNVPSAVVALKNAESAKQLSVKDSGTFPVPVNIHVNVGTENNGKYANLYRYNAEKKQLEYCGSFVVTRNGQSMFALKQGGDYVVTVTASQPKETVYFANAGYAVKAGDTLSAIASRSHMSLAELKAKNPQIKDLHKIRVGQKINLN